MSLGERISRRLDRVQEFLPGPAERFMARLRGEDVLLPSAGLAFYALISMAPLLIVVLWLTSIVAGDSRVEQLSQQMRGASPKGMGIGSLFTQVAREGTSLGLGSALFALWPATAYGGALARGFERVAGRERSMSGLRGRALLVLVVLPVFVVGALGASFLGTALLGDGVLRGLLGGLLALVAGFAAAAVGIALIFRIFPPEPIRWPRLLKVTAAAAAGVSVLSLLFVLYLNLGANFEERYASSTIGGIVLLGGWLFLSNALLLTIYAGVER